MRAGLRCGGLAFLAGGLPGPMRDLLLAPGFPFRATGLAGIRPPRDPARKAQGHLVPVMRRRG